MPLPKRKLIFGYTNKAWCKMKNLLQIKEYQFITHNDDYKAEQGYAYLPETIFQELETFILQNKPEVADSVAMDFFQITTKRGIGKVISARNYVGIIQMRQGTQIEILPKIYLDNEKKGETKNIFLRMLRSMKDFPNKVYDNANLRVANMSLYEIFINMYIQEVRVLVKKGLKLNYVPVEENNNFYKGKLLVKEHIRFNLSHGERFYIRHDEFNANRSENRLIKSTLIKLARLSSSSENAREIRQLLSYFEMVEPSINYEKDFSRVKIDRNTKEYEQIIKGSKVFLLNKSFTSFAGTSNARALLFPMEKVFESYVAQQLKKVLNESNYQISIQDRGYYLFDVPSKQFALRPDIVIKNDTRTIVLDTKWKILDNTPKYNYGISQADMYQMYAYAKKYNTNEVWLLYPKSQLMDEINTEIAYESNDGVKVRLWFVDLNNIENNMDRLEDELSIRAIC